MLLSHSLARPAGGNAVSLLSEALPILHAAAESGKFSNPQGVGMKTRFSMMALAGALLLPALGAQAQTAAEADGWKFVARLRREVGEGEWRSLIGARRAGQRAG